MKSRNFSTVMLIAILVVSLFTGIVSASEDSRPIKIGLVGCFTGPLAMYGPFLEHGFMMGVNEINAAGGVLGHKIEVIKEDDCSVPATGVNAANKLINKDKVDIIFGSLSSAITLPMSKVTSEAGVPQISLSLAASITKQGNPYIFRIRPPADFEGPTMGKFVVETLGKKRIAVFRSSTEAGVSRSDGFIQGLTEVGVEPVIVETHNVGDKDFTGQLMKIKAKNPDFVYLPVQEVEGGLIIKQARQMGFNVRFGGDSGIATDVTMNIAKDGINGTVVVLPFAPTLPDPIIQEWVKRFMEIYPDEVPDQHDAGSYDAAYIIKHAIEMAGSLDKEKIKDALHNIKDFPCLVGTCTYDESGEGFKEEYIVMIEEGEFLLLGKVNAEGKFIDGGLTESYYKYEK